MRENVLCLKVFFDKDFIDGKQKVIKVYSLSPQNFSGMKGSVQSLFEYMRTALIEMNRKYEISFRKRNDNEAKAQANAEVV